VQLAGEPVAVGGLRLDAASLRTGATVDLTVATTGATTTLAGLSGALAGYGGPAAAAAVDLGAGATPARLVLSAAKTGTANGLLVSGTGDLAALAGGTAVTKSASDAVVTMGSLTVTRPSNTVDDLLPGVTLSLLKAAPGSEVTVKVGRDAAASAGKVQALVTSLNSALDLLDKVSAYDTAAKTGQPLSGDSRVRQLSQDLSELGSVLGTGTTGTMSQLGVSITRDGRYTFDSAAFTKQLAADPDGVTALVGNAGNSLSSVLDSALGTLGKTGWIKTAQSGATADADRIQTRIEEWDVRLAATEARYRSQFAAVDAAISSLNSQKSWLSSTIAGLAANSGSK
jgi:flagellar hook-associated protein 2